MPIIVQGIRWLRIRKQDTVWISKLILFIAFAGAYIISAWLSAEWYHEQELSLPYSSKLIALLPAAAVNMAALMIVAMLGRYDRCIREMLAGEDEASKKIIAWLMLTFTALLTAAVSTVCLAGAWVLLQKAKDISGLFRDYRMEVKFILGFPLVLEVFSVTLVARMALLGRYFPDERREWWGRMGAFIHRTSFLWTLIAASALLGKYFIFWAFEQGPVISTAVTGGWAAMILSAVKAAFSSTASGDKKSTSSLATFVNILALLGPYLFALGLLIFLPGLIRPIYNLTHDKVVQNPTVIRENLVAVCIVSIIIACCFLTSLLLSMQVGVNEFSMHHFYRNRLVRAYLGATRRATDRQKSSNPFTGF